MSPKTHTSIFNIAHRVSTLIVSGLLICSCARIMALGGGPKDTTPPQLIKAYPMQDSTGFKGKVIKLVFDKKIEVEDLYNELVITPRLPKLGNTNGYTYSVRGNKLQLTLQVPLEKATTYTFNFSDAIKDTTEGNIATGVILSFSTGDSIDAMHVTGQVKHLMTALPASKALVSLYKVDNENRSILNSPPDYSIKTDEAGKFQLTHIKKGQYYIYASDNGKYAQTIDPGVDAYGFLKDPINLTAVSADDVTLSILKADAREFKLQFQKPQNQYFTLRFSKPVVDYKLTLVKKSKKLKGEPTLCSHLVEDRQVIRIYNTLGLLEEDSIEAHLTAQDVLGTVIEQNVTIHFREYKGKNTPASYTFYPNSGAAILPAFVGTMLINKPVKEVSTDRLSFVLYGKEVVNIDTQDLKFNAQQDAITITKQLNTSMPAPSTGENEEREAAEVILQMDEGAFVTVEGDSSEAMRYVYNYKHPKECGTIKGKVTTEAPGFIVQLLDEEYNVVDSIKNEHQYQFNDVAVGSYRLRLLVLQDKEGAWRLGNIHKRQEPDPVVLYPASVAVIANWEIEGIDFVF